MIRTRQPVCSFGLQVSFYKTNKSKQNSGMAGSRAGWSWASLVLQLFLLLTLCKVVLTLEQQGGCREGLHMAPREGPCPRLHVSENPGHLTEAQEGSSYGLQGWEWKGSYYPYCLAVLLVAWLTAQSLLALNFTVFCLILLKAGIAGVQRPCPHAHVAFLGSAIG